MGRRLGKDKLVDTFSLTDYSGNLSVEEALAPIEESIILDLQRQGVLQTDYLEPNFYILVDEKREREINFFTFYLYERDEKRVETFFERILRRIKL